MIHTKDGPDVLTALQSWLLAETPEMEAEIAKAHAMNPWFIPEFTRQAIRAIAEDFLDKEKIAAWQAAYDMPGHDKKNVALIMAGNVPLVGFHDLLCVVTSGHTAQIKLSDKDPLLMPFITDRWIREYPALADSISYVDKVEGYDAVIATGSNNSARYFEYYFRNKPFVVRRNRHAVAVLTGDETPEQLQALAEDIFYYFGLGCRNVSKIYVPEDYDFSAWHDAIAAWKFLSDHNKYRNNLDYNTAIYLINSVPHIHLGHLMLKEDEAIASRIGCVHYSRYRHLSEVAAGLKAHREEVQCVISATQVDGWETIALGQGQHPQLDQYADGVDTMQFLLRL